MEECVLQIKTGMYSEPFLAEGSYSEEDGIRKYQWTEKHPNEKIASDFELTCDTDGKRVTVIRGGDVASSIKSGLGSDHTLRDLLNDIGSGLFANYVSTGSVSLNARLISLENRISELEGNGGFDSGI